MTDFSNCFLLVFGQLAVGGMAGLAVPPFTVIERGFYKSSAGVFLGCGALFLIGKITLVLRSGGPTVAQGLELVLWGGFVLATALYLAALWGDSGLRRARTYTAALLLGVVALATSASAYRLGSLWSPITLLYPLAFLTGALTLGAVATGMLLGHWYLIDLGLSIVPLQRLFRYFMTVVLVQLGTIVLTTLLMAVTPGPAAAAVANLWTEHASLLALRLVLGPGATLALGYMIHRTLQIPQTMAATGLFYIAILAVMVGELLGRLILFRTSLPL